MARKRIGDLLVESGLLTSEQLTQALVDQKQSSQRLGDVLISRGYIQEEQLIEVLEFQLGIPHVQISRQQIDPSVLNLIPERLAKTYQVIPLRKEGSKLFVAMIDPLDYYAIDDIRMTTGFLIEPAIATKEEIQRAITRFYDLQESVDEVMQTLPTDLSVNDEDISNEDSPVVRMLNHIIIESVHRKASDIHLDPQELGVKIRYRVDGILRTERELPKHLQNIMIARIKILSGLNIAERRLPQDGRFQLDVDLRQVDIRVSTLPTAYGEKVVLRILDTKNVIHAVEHLGLSPMNLEKFEYLLNLPYGAVFITGPTGSGKTSTLYAALKRLTTDKVNVVTIEDPVEYQMDGVNQVQVNPVTGLVFARGLRAILRQDPDIIMVGEIRDSETAEIAIRSALTGHLVFSTLHTNDATSSINRLIDMGVEPYIVASAVRGIVAQRLVRKVCPECKMKYTPREIEAQWLLEKNLSTDQLVIGRGCSACGKTGYRGRLAIHEVMVLDDELAKMVMEHQSDQAYREVALKKGMVPMLDDGLQKAAAGLTTLAEVLRVTVHSMY